MVTSSGRAPELQLRARRWLLYRRLRAMPWKTYALLLLFTTVTTTLYYRYYYSLLPASPRHAMEG